MNVKQALQTRAQLISELARVDERLKEHSRLTLARLAQAVFAGKPRPVLDRLTDEASEANEIAPLTAEERDEVCRPWRREGMVAI